jgi:hypothetical protein
MSAPSGPDTVRASDAEREEFARIVREAVGEGRLSLEEGDERLGKIYESRFRADLPPIIQDLPDAEFDGSRSANGGLPADDGSWGPDRPGGPWRRGRPGGPFSGGRPGGPWGRPDGPWGGGRTGGPWGRSEGPWSDRPWGPGSGRRGGPRLRGLAFGAVVAGILVGIWALTGAHFFWPIFPILFIFLAATRRRCV